MSWKIGSHHMHDCLWLHAAGAGNTSCWVGLVRETTEAAPDDF